MSKSQHKNWEEDDEEWEVSKVQEYLQSNNTTIQQVRNQTLNMQMWMKIEIELEDTILERTGEVNEEAMIFMTILIDQYAKAQTSNNAWLDINFTTKIVNHLYNQYLLYLNNQTHLYSKMMQRTVKKLSEHQIDMFALAETPEEVQKIVETLNGKLEGSQTIINSIVQGKLLPCQANQQRIYTHEEPPGQMVDEKQETQEEEVPLNSQTIQEDSQHEESSQELNTSYQEELQGELEDNSLILNQSYISKDNEKDKQPHIHQNSHTPHKDTDEPKDNPKELLQPSHISVTDNPTQITVESKPNFHSQSDETYQSLLQNFLLNVMETQQYEDSSTDYQTYEKDTWQWLNEEEKQTERSHDQPGKEQELQHSRDRHTQRLSQSKSPPYNLKHGEPKETQYKHSKTTSKEQDNYQDNCKKQRKENTRIALED